MGFIVQNPKTGTLEALECGRLNARDYYEGREKYDVKPPEPRECKFCGAALYAMGMKFGPKVIWMERVFEKCQCPAAEKERADLAAQKAREEEENRIAEERRLRRERVEKLLNTSGIKARFRQRTFANFQQITHGRAKAYNAAKRYADNFETRKAIGEGLYIEGSNGTGKTHLAAAIALELIDRGVPVIFRVISDLLKDITAAYDKKKADESYNEQAVLNLFKTVDLLIIDDLGKEYCTDWAISTLYNILNDRYENMLPVIITTNYNTEELIRRLTPQNDPLHDDQKARAIVSRLCETSKSIIMAWEDWRTTGGNAT